MANLFDDIFDDTPVAALPRSQHDDDKNMFEDIFTPSPPARSTTFFEGEQQIRTGKPYVIPRSLAPLEPKKQEELQRLAEVGIHPEQARAARPTREEQERGLEIPLVDPVSAFVGGAAGATTLGMKAGLSLLPAAGRGVLSGALGAATDIPIGQAAEEISGGNPLIALPFAVLVGLVSGVTLERAIEQRVLRMLTKGTTQASSDVVEQVTKQVQSAMAEGRPRDADTILKLAQDAIVPQVTPPSTTKAQKLTRSITELAGEAVAPPTPKFLRTAEDLLQEQVDKGVLTPKVFEHPDVPPGVTKLAAEEPLLTLKNGTEVIPGRLDAKGAETTRELAAELLESADDTATIGKMIDSINVERLDTTDDVRGLIGAISKRIAPLVKKSRRGIVPLDETKRMAMRSGISEQAMLKRKPGTVWNAEQSTAASMVNLSSARRTMDLARRVTEGGSDAELLEFRLAVEKHQLIQASEAGLATEAGRTLSARRIIKAETDKPVKNLQAMIDALGGREITETMARRLAMINPENTAAVNKYLQEVTNASTVDKIYEVWINALLSSPVTHVVNTTSNALTLLTKLPEKALAAGYDAIGSAMTGKPRTRLLGEVAAEVFAMKQGLQRGVQNMLWAFRTGLPSDAQSKLEVRTFKAIKGTTGEVVRLPGRALIMMDEFFKGVNGVMETHAQAFRHATMEGLIGDKKAQRMAALILQPTEEMAKAIREEQLYRVFQADLGHFGRAILKVRMGDQPSHIAARLVVPFARTPINIAKYGLERTPLGFLRLAQKSIIKEGLIEGEGADRAARATLGTIIGATVYSYMADGHVTGGGPKDQAKRAAKYRTGWQPYSIKAGDTYYSYARIEPMGSVVGMAADLYESYEDYTEDERINIAARIVRSFATNITSKTWLRGPSDVINVLSDPDRYAERYFESILSTTVPRVVASAGRATDEYLRESDSVGEYIQSQIPYLSHALLPKRNIWGEAIEREGGAVSKFISPFRTSEIKGTIADREMLRLGIAIGKPSKKIGETELTPQQYDQLMIHGGQQAKERVLQYITSPGYARVDDEIKADIIRKRYDQGMKIARIRLKQQLRQRQLP